MKKLLLVICALLLALAPASVMAKNSGKSKGPSNWKMTRKRLKAKRQKNKIVIARKRKKVKNLETSRMMRLSMRMAKRR